MAGQHFLKHKEMMLLNCGVGEDSWESFYCKEIKPVNPKGDQPWVFIGRTDSEAETPILWSSDGKSWLIRKDSDAGKDWRQEKRMTEVEILGWHHQLITNSPEQAPEDGEEQGTLTCCSPWGCKESNMTEQLNNNNSILKETQRFQESRSNVTCPGSHKSRFKN